MNSTTTETLTKLRENLDNTSSVDFSEFEKQKVDYENSRPGMLHNRDGYECKLCNNKGYIAELDNGENIILKECKCMNIRKTLRLAKNSGLGNILTELTFDKFNDTETWQTEIKNKAKSFCNDNNAKWFYIGGQVGCGKTHICTAIAAHYIKLGKTVKYMLWAKESKKFKTIINDSSYMEEMKKYENCEVLYIDDFLKTKNGGVPTDGDLNLAFEIINHRILDNDKITIISSEKTLDEIINYDEATMSRIFQKTGNYKINIEKDKNKNYRLK